MVSPLDSGSNGFGSNSGWDHCFVLLGKIGHRRIKNCGGGGLALGGGVEFQPGGSRNTPGRYMLLKPEISRQLNSRDARQEKRLLVVYNV